MMYNILYNSVLVLNCEKADLTTNKLNGSTNILFYNTVIIVHYSRYVQSVKSSRLHIPFPTLSGASKTTFIAYEKRVVACMKTFRG